MQSPLPSIHPSVSTLIFEPSDLWPWPFVSAWVMITALLKLKVKVKSEGLKVKVESRNEVSGTTSDGNSSWMHSDNISRHSHAVSGEPVWVGWLLYSTPVHPPLMTDHTFTSSLTPPLNSDNYYYYYNCYTTRCPGLPKWVGTRRINCSGFCWSRDDGMAVASAEPYASYLHFSPEDNHASTSSVRFVRAGCPSWHPVSYTHLTLPTNREV